MRRKMEKMERKNNSISGVDFHLIFSFNIVYTQKTLSANDSTSIYNHNTMGTRLSLVWCPGYNHNKSKYKNLQSYQI